MSGCAPVAPFLALAPHVGVPIACVLPVTCLVGGRVALAAGTRGQPGVEYRFDSFAARRP